MTNFEIQNYHKNEPKFKVIFSQSNLQTYLANTIKDGAYIENLDEYKSVEIHWVALYVNGNSVTCFFIANILEIEIIEITH